MTHARKIPRRGTMLPMLAVTCFALFGFVALAVDLGMLMVARTECQNAADAAALIGARMLDNNVPQGTDPASYDNQRDSAKLAATNAVKENYLLQNKFAFNDASVDRVEIGIYDYDTTSQVFNPIFHPPTVSDPRQKIVNNGSVRPWTACRVTVKGDQPTYFARIFGVATMPMSARATAAHRPRDIAMVLDFSGSMMFGSSSHYPPGFGSSNDAVIGLLNPDTRYPRFGHHQRYDGRQVTNPSGTNPHPYRMTGTFIAASGEAFAPNNYTIETDGGPPQVNDYYQSTNSNPSASVNPANLVSAFNINGMPRGEDYNTQSLPLALTTIGPVGDRSPRKGGERFGDDVSWNPSNATGAARNVSDLLARTAVASLTKPTFSSTSTPTIPQSVHGGTNWNVFFDLAWETLGYDLDIPHYISTNEARPRETELFQGYTLGPGYWGKTFFMWPPDPRYGPMPGVTRSSSNMPAVGSPDPSRPSFDTSGRAMCDWRQRFFLKGDGSTFNPQVDNINQLLLNSATNTAVGSGGAFTLNPNHTGSSPNFRINYRAVLAWLKTGPQVLPNNLRAGRILFYTAIPDDCTSPANDNERFWRDYIDFVLGFRGNRTWYNPAYSQAGVDTTAWGTQQLGAINATGFRPNTNLAANPRPYMEYRDVPNMPRAHFWFGPHSMMMFLNIRGGFTGSSARNWTPGTVREAQSWQLKAAIQSALDDIRKNHPNDQCGMAFFAHSNFRTPRVAMGQDWERLKASLFFPKNLPGGADNGAFLDAVLNGTALEVRPYNSSMTSTLTGNLPNANGATDPNHGLSLAYNMLSSSTAVGAGGRRGASKIVIFETDGVPNSYQNWSYVASGSNSRYNFVNTGASGSNGSAISMSTAYDVVQQIVQPTTSGSPGFSLPNSPARVYSFAFGDLFSTNSSFKPTALTFLQTIAYYGNTNDSTSTPLPAEQVITGSYTTRISNLRTGLERVLQNGVQVTLIE